MVRSMKILIITVVTIVWLMKIEARYDENIARHRHRHHHVLTSRKSHDIFNKVARKHESAMKNDDNSEDGVNDDSMNKKDHHRRNYDDFYSHLRYRQNPRYSSDEMTEQRRRNVRYGSNVRGHRAHPWIYRSDYNPRGYDYDDDIADYDEYDRGVPRWHHHHYYHRHGIDDQDLPRWRGFPVHRRDDYFYGSRYINSRKDWRRSELRRKANRQEDDKNGNYDDDDWMKGIMKINGTRSSDDDKENIWKDSEADLFDDDDDEDGDEEEEEEDERDDDEDDDGGDGDDGDVDEDDDDIGDGDGERDSVGVDDGVNDDNYNYSDNNPPYKTYDDIIKSLTSDDTKSIKSTSVKRDYRNIEIEKYLKRDAYGNLKYQPKYINNNLINKKQTINSSGSNKYYSYKKDTTNDVKKLTNDFFNKEDGFNDKHSDIQADKEYTDDEDETSVTLPLSSTTVRTPSTVTSTLSRTITTQRDPRSYDTSTVYINTINSHKPQPSKTTTPSANKNGKSAEIREAMQHAMKVSREGSCQWPRARVIPVRDVYPSPSTTYIPHCAILHRCSDDTGCCRSEALTCVPKQSHKVELYFYTTSIEGTSVVEKLSFYNHTECECRKKSEYAMANDAKPSIKQQSPPENIRRPPPKKLCKCPSEFTPRITLEGECRCGCFDSAQLCIKARLGKGYFSLADRVCIQNKKCAMPDCDYGEYIMRQGKCPRKKDRFDIIANYPSHINHRFRS